MQPTKVIFRDEAHVTTAYITDLDEMSMSPLGSVRSRALYRNPDLTHEWMSLMERLHNEENRAIREGKIL